MATDACHLIRILRLRQKCHMFKARLGYLMRPCPPMRCASLLSISVTEYWPKAMWGGKALLLLTITWHCPSRRAVTWKQVLNQRPRKGCWLLTCPMIAQPGNPGPLSEEHLCPDFTHQPLVKKMPHILAYRKLSQYWLQ